MGVQGGRTRTGMNAMNTMLETLETRTLMSASPATTFVATDAGNPEPVGLLVPAVQAAREAARSSAHSGGVNVLLADGSVRFVSGANFILADGSVRFISDSIAITPR